MPFSFDCIACSGKMDANKQNGKLQCQRCGRFLDGTYPENNGTQEQGIEETDEQQWVLGGLLYKGETNPWMRSMVSSLRSQLQLGQREEAIQTCRRLLEMERNFLDAHLWIARLSDDEAEKRHHLDKLVALDPHNIEATRLLLVLNGEMTEEESKRSEDLYRDNLQFADEPVAAATESLLCPICRGTLTVNENQQVACAFCGFTDESATNAVRATPDTSLAVALIKQRGKAVRWQVGQRMVHCDECGAERVLPAGKMSTRCPFCNSTHVVVQDTLGAFRQPDGIVRFKVRRKDAEAAVHSELNSRAEKLKGWFVDNRVAHIRYEGVYLPYWSFDIFGKAILTDSYRDAKEFATQTKRQEVAHQLHNALVSAIDSLPRSMLGSVDQFTLSETIPYTPKVLSKFAAELYHRDFDAASLDVRETFRQAAVERNRNLNPNLTRTVMTHVDHMVMRLLLLPFWIATITEKDDEVRIALVNGQTSRTTLGKARKPTS